MSSQKWTNRALPVNLVVLSIFSMRSDELFGQAYWTRWRIDHPKNALLSAALVTLRTRSKLDALKANQKLQGVTSRHWTKLFQRSRVDSTIVYRAFKWTSTLRMKRRSLMMSTNWAPYLKHCNIRNLCSFLLRLFGNQQLYTATEALKRDDKSKIKSTKTLTH